jgi:general transcription factor 3C polypeptide 5 (transcription factor C subunit 1)
MAAAEPDADPKAAIPVDLRRERRLVCVEYPGVVRNEAKMLQTLGGEESVSRVRSWETPGPRERNRVY